MTPPPPHRRAGLRNAIQLIAYPDRMGDTLADLRSVVDRHLSKAIGGVHVLPP